MGAPVAISTPNFGDNHSKAQIICQEVVFFFFVQQRIRAFAAFVPRSILQGVAFDHHLLRSQANISHTAFQRGIAKKKCRSNANSHDKNRKLMPCQKNPALQTDDIPTSCPHGVLGVPSRRGVSNTHSTSPNMLGILCAQGNKLTVAQLIRGMLRECSAFTRVTVLSPELGPEVDFIKVPGLIFMRRPPASVSSFTPM